jgi:LmbE family N-acetylglucosaminyl deacetylase
VEDLDVVTHSREREGEERRPRAYSTHGAAAAQLVRDESDPAGSHTLVISMSGSGTLVALSPHLDDAVFSIGAFMHEQARRGVDVRVVTVFANDPSADGPAGPWDAMCGFASAAAAARARREEDRRACAIVGAQPRWLAYDDESHERTASDDEIWRGVRDVIADCALLLMPGFPLRQADHARLTELVLQRRAELPFTLGFYAEQPYASTAFARGDDAAAPLPVEFERVPTGAKDRYAKLRASLQYRSQLRALGPWALLRAFREGELVAVPPNGAG